MKTHLYKTILSGLMISCLASAMQFSTRAAEPPNPQPPAPAPGPTDFNPPPSEREIPGTPANPLTTTADTTVTTDVSSPKNAGQLSASDYKFATKAAQGGLMEVKLGQIASQKSSDPEIKKFGDRMVEDHGKAGKELEQIASQKGATLPAELSKMHQRHVDHLNSLTGSDFDKAYVAMMVKDHKADLKEFKEAAETAQDADLKAFASRTAPVVEEHLKMIQGIEQTMKSKLSKN